LKQNKTVLELIKRGFFVALLKRKNIVLKMSGQIVTL